jgi:hypothetical protein
MPDLTAAAVAEDTWHVSAELDWLDVLGTRAFRSST